MLRAVPGRKHKPSEPSLMGAVISQEQLLAGRGRTRGLWGEVGGESIWTQCKQKGKVSCLDTGMIEGQNLTKG